MDDSIREVINQHSATIKRLADRCNTLTAQNAELLKRLYEAEKQLLAIRLKIDSMDNNPFKGIF